MSEQQQEEQQQQQAPEQQEEDNTPSLQDLLDQAGGPSKEDIEKLKLQYKEVYVSGFSETELYVWRPLMRSEFRELQAQLNNPQTQMDQLEYEEKICETCVLWPRQSSADFASAKGGTASSLAEQIMQNSNFFNPQQVSMLVQKL